jgi:hypothetical protein
MSTASGLSTEDLASSLLGTKGGSGLEACFAPPVRRDRLSGKPEAA